MAKQAVLTLEEIDLLEPTFIGPTWQKDAFGRWVLPDKTLGWQVASRRLSVMELTRPAPIM